MSTQGQVDNVNRQVAIEQAAGINSKSGVSVTPPPATPVASPAAPTTPAPVTPTPSATSSGDPSLDAINNLQSFGDTAQGQSMINDINTLTNKLASGTLSEDEQKQVQDQADATKAQYDQLIAQAQQEKQQGMAKNLVAAGQRGGLMNTQFAGVAAVSPTNAGNFVGAGGELNRIQSEYDLNISNLKAQQIQAVTDAQQKMKDAIKSGHQEDLDIAMNAYDLAKGLQDDHNAMVAEKAQALSDYKTQQLQYQQYQRDTASGTIDAMVKSGLDPTTIPDDVFAAIDAQGGYVSGTSKGMMEVAQAESEAASEQAQFDQATKMVDLLTKLPVGQSINIAGVDYMSLNQGTVKTFSEDDGNGNTTIVSYNEDKNTWTSQKFPGISKKDGWQFIQQNGVGMYVNPNTQAPPVVAFDSNQFNSGQSTDTGVYAAFPEGTKLDATGYGLGQCGVFAENLTTFDGKMGDSFQSKMKVTNPNISAANNNITPGDIAVLNMGANGHAAVVLGTSIVDGKTIVHVVQSNLDGKGTVTYGQYDDSQIGGYIPAQLKPEYAFGSDATGGLDTNQALQDFSGTSSTGKLTSDQLKTQNQIADNARQDKNISQFPDVRASYETARSAAEDASGTSDVVLMRMLAKISDPTTGVREEEFQTFGNAQGILKQYGISLTKQMWTGERLNDYGRQQLLQQAQDIYDQRESAYNNSYDFYNNQAVNQGLPDGSVMPYYVAPETPQDKQPTLAPVDNNFYKGLFGL